MKNISIGIFLLIFSTIEVFSLEKCEWKNDEGKPCLIISKTPNTSSVSKKKYKQNKYY